MKILIICQSFLREGGSGNPRFNQFAQSWVDLGHQVTVVAARLDPFGKKKDTKHNWFLVTEDKDFHSIKVFRCYVSQLYNKNFYGRFFAYVTFLFSSVVAVLFSGRHDVVIASSPPLVTAIPAYLVSRLQKIPLIFEVRDLWPKFAVDLAILKNRHVIRYSQRLERFIYQRSTGVIVLSPAYRGYLVSENGVDDGKISFIPNPASASVPVEEQDSRTIRNRYGWNGKCIVLYSGTFGVAHDLQQILDVAQITDDPAILFVLIGNGIDKVRLEMTARQKKISNVQFLDSVPQKNIFSFIRAADLCVATLHPALITTYPNKIFDYMICAKPIILSVDGAARELVVVKAQAGVFVEPRDPRKFKAAILRLYRNQDLSQEYGRNGYRYVRENHDRDELAKKYLDFIRVMRDNRVMG